MTAAETGLPHIPSNRGGGGGGGGECPENRIDSKGPDITYGEGRHQNSPLKATNCFKEMLVSCFCDFCGTLQKAITITCEW